MKKEIRVIGIDDSPFAKFQDKESFIIGAVFRGGSFIDGILSARVYVDGNDSTDKISEMINSSKFRTQLQAILLDGIAVAGFNIVDIEQLWQKTKIPVIVIMRSYPELDNLKSALEKTGHSQKIKSLENAGPIHKAGNLFIQKKGLHLKEAEEIIKITSTHSLIPEPIRVAHLIAGGVAEGQSRGRA